VIGWSLLVPVCRNIWEGGATERRRRTATCHVCLLFITAPSSLFPRHLIRPDYRVIAIYATAACGTLSQLYTWTRCEARPCARSLQWNAVCRAAGQSSVHRGRDRVLFIPRIPLSPIRLYWQIAVRAGSWIINLHATDEKSELPVWVGSNLIKWCKITACSIERVFMVSGFNIRKYSSIFTGFLIL